MSSSTGSSKTKPSWVRPSPNSRRAMKSDWKSTVNATGSQRATSPRRPVDMSWRSASSFFRAWYSEESSETATASPEMQMDCTTE